MSLNIVLKREVVFTNGSQAELTGIEDRER